MFWNKGRRVRLNRKPWYDYVDKYRTRGYKYYGIILKTFGTGTQNIRRVDFSLPGK